MADAASAANEPSAVPSMKELKHALYARCATQRADRVFTQQDLLAFDVIPDGDLKQLQACTTQLSKEGLLKMMTKDGKLCWKLVKKEDAAKYDCASPIPPIHILTGLLLVGTKRSVRKRPSSTLTWNPPREREYGLAQSERVLTSIRQ